MYLEKIVGIYDSRQEAPLSSIMSVNVQTADSIERAVRMGDVVVRTYSGPITLKSVANPNVLAAAIEEHWYRTRIRQKEGQREANRRQLRERLEFGPPKVKPSKPPPPKAAPKAKPLLVSLADFFSFRVRYEEGDAVVYRKHWWILLQDIWKPSLGMLIVIVLLTLVAAGYLPILPLSYAAVMAVVGPGGAGRLVAVSIRRLAQRHLHGDGRTDLRHRQETAGRGGQEVGAAEQRAQPEVRAAGPARRAVEFRQRRGARWPAPNFASTVCSTRWACRTTSTGRIEAQKAKKQAGEEARLREEMVDWLEDYTTGASGWPTPRASRARPPRRHQERGRRRP